MTNLDHERLESDKAVVLNDFADRLVEVAVPSETGILLEQDVKLREILDFGIKIEVEGCEGKSRQTGSEGD